MNKLIFFLAPLLLVGCVGDGGGTAYQGQLGDEQGNKSPETGFGGTDSNLFALCMQICVQEADEEYCRTDVCAQLNTSPRPDTPEPSPELGDGDGDGQQVGDGDASSGDEAFCFDLTQEMLDAYCADSGGVGCENLCFGQ